MIDEIFGENEGQLQLTFIMDYPVEMSLLPKYHSIEGLVERFELIVTGKSYVMRIQS